MRNPAYAIPAPAAADRAAAMLRFNLCEVLAELLARRVPDYVGAFDADEEIEAELQPTDAHELARDLVEDLAIRGFVIGRAPA